MHVVTVPDADTPRSSRGQGGSWMAWPSLRSPGPGSGEAGLTQLIRQCRPVDSFLFSVRPAHLQSPRLAPWGTLQMAVLCVLYETLCRWPSQGVWDFLVPSCLSPTPVCAPERTRSPVQGLSLGLCLSPGLR